METPPPSPSLVERLRDAAAGGDSGGSRAVGVALALLLAAGPALTWAGAEMLIARDDAESRALRRSAEPALSLAATKSAARATLGPLVGRPTAGATIDALARVLPAEATLLRAERNADGYLSIEVAAPDPDRLREALRREPVTENLRNTGQRGGDGAMIVTFEQRR